jgi:hypothetical protein
MTASLPEVKTEKKKQSESDEDQQRQRPRFVKMRGLYPKGGPKIVRQEFERLGFTYLPGNAPNGFVQFLGP